MKILFAGFRDSNHSAAGGYDPISLYPGADYYNGSFISFKSNRDLWDKIKLRLSLKYFYLMVRLKRNKYDLVHCFYGDTAAYPFHKSKKHKIVLTIHLDVEERKRAPRKFLKLLQQANGVIVLGSEQARILREKYNIKATFIPHGFNKPVFDLKIPKITHGFENSKIINVALSGKQYRDQDVIIKIIKYLEESNNRILFHAFGQPLKIKNELEECKNIIFYPRVSDDEYYTVLSKCDYNFLPVKFATANNALLEGEFLGIKGILPDIPGIQDYAAPYPLNLFYQDYESLKHIFDNLIPRKEHSEELIKYANRFVWPNIYEKLKSYYETL